MQMYYYCDVIACLIQICRIMHIVTWLFLGYGFLAKQVYFMNLNRKHYLTITSLQGIFVYTTVWLYVMWHEYPTKATVADARGGGSG